jgi:hypothetical protein
VKVVSLSEMRKLQCAKLRLSVINRTLRWEFWPDAASGGDRDDIDLTFSETDKVLIEMLADVQQLLIELRPDEPRQRDAVNATLFRVAAELGDRLYRVLFQDSRLVDALSKGLQGPKAGTHFFRIELEFSGSGAFMAAWPWEYLHQPGQPGKPESGTFLAVSTNLVLNRLLGDRWGAKFSTRTPSLLLVVARPRGLDPVDCNDVIGVTQQLDDENIISLKELVEPKPSEYIEENYRPAASWAAFKEYVDRYKPQVIHFIGHGQLIFAGGRNVGQLAFVGDDGKPHWIDEEEFAQAVQHPELRLVFLQACESGRSDLRVESSGIAKSLILKQVPAVVAMQAKVHNLVANTFARTVYAHLKTGLPIDFAVMRGREAIKDLQDLGASEKKLFFGVPVVYLGTHHGLIDTAEPETKPQPHVTGVPERIAPTPPDPAALACPLCSNKVLPQMTFCNRCGVQLLCTNPDRQRNPCARLISPSFEPSFCSECGFPIPRRTPPPLQQAAIERPAPVSGDGTLSEPTLLKDKNKQMGPSGTPPPLGNPGV